MLDKGELLVHLGGVIFLAFYMAEFLLMEEVEKKGSTLKRFLKNLRYTIPLATVIVGLGVVGNYLINPRPIQIQGTVVNEAGQPIPDMVLSLAEEIAIGPNGEVHFPLLTGTETDANGTYLIESNSVKIPPGRYYLVLWKDEGVDTAPVEIGSSLFQSEWEGPIFVLRK